jgi:hypothetical protein
MPEVNILRALPDKMAFRSLTFVLPIILAVGLSACEPSFSIAWSKDFQKPIQISCIRDALTSASTKLTLGTYTSDGARGFPKGITVTQFGYADPYGEGYFNLDIARVSSSRVRFYHSFEKSGNRPSDEYIQKSVVVLNRNNEKIAAECNLEFSPEDFQKS